MRITADTNVLVRALVNDDPDQGAEARRLLARAERVAVPVPVFCELVWVLGTGYRRSRAEIADALEAVLGSETVATDAAAVAAGLDTLRRGGDFADGVAAFAGMALGGEVFASFDAKAVRVSLERGVAAAHPARLAPPDE